MGKSANAKRARGPSPQPGERHQERTRDNRELRRTAHERLDRLLDMAEAEEKYGTVGIDVQMRAGLIDLVQERLTGSHKPAAT